MKKLLLSLIMLFPLLQGLSAQEHMKFMGIPIDGSISDFETKLVEKGFVNNGTGDNTSSILKGKFTGKDVDVLIEWTSKSRLVCRVLVFFEKEDSWSSIKKIFNNYKDLLSEKYGTPSSDYHFFMKPYYEGDGYEMQALRMDKVRYSTFWHITEGDINLNMAKQSFVVINYEDKANMHIYEKEKLETDLNDI